MDDGSRDRTPVIAAALAAADPRVRVVTHPRRRGIGQAIRTGLREARGEWYLMLPADLALRLEQLPRYFAAAAAADVVLGVCPDRSDYSPYRTLLSRANVGFIQALFRLPHHQYNYVNLYRTAVVQPLLLRYTGSAFLYAEIVVRAIEQGARIARSARRLRATRGRPRHGQRSAPRPAHGPRHASLLAVRPGAALGRDATCSPAAPPRAARLAGTRTKRVPARSRDDR